jgi:thiol-disulfide isomerase/thioredoxin
MISLELEFSLALTIASCALVAHATDTKEPVQFGKSSVPIEGDFGDGWQQTIILPDSPYIAGGKVLLRVDDGWLCARRESTDGQCEWQFVLCQVDETSPPKIEVRNGMPVIDISCHDDRYFIRDSSFLRVLREPVSGTKLLTKDELLTADAQLMGYGGACTAWRDADWFFVTAGEERDAWRAFVRLNSMDERKKGYGVTTSISGPTHYFHGDTWFIDDGELLVAKRMSLAAYDAQKKHEAARAAVLAGQLPVIDATEWLNSDQPLNWEALRGKVVLVDFWATWCGPCVAKLPVSQRLHDQYRERGLAVIGIHSEQDADTCASFLKENGYTFPVALDSGKTAEKFAISGWPSYFLIDRAGKVVQSFMHEPPSDQVIEELLSAAVP